jgi:hypothetical protein
MGYVSVLYFYLVGYDKYHSFPDGGGLLKIRTTSALLRWGSLAFILLAAVLLVVELVRYSVQRADYPADMTIGGVAVGGLTPDEASQRLLEVYSTPVQLDYGGAIIQLDPGLIGFSLNTDSMLAEADLLRTGAPFWSGFWDFLWNRPSPTHAVPLVFTFSEDRLRTYLSAEISSRYDQQPAPARPIPGTTQFKSGNPGRVLDINQAVNLIENALQSPTSRTVTLAAESASPGRPSAATLETMLKQIIDASGFDGLVDLYFLDLQSGEQIHFAHSIGQDYPVIPTDIAFSAASTIKIPIMIAVYQHSDGKLDSQTALLMTQMLDDSSNSAADTLMDQIDPGRGPLAVTKIMQTLGLQNTFLGMYYAAGSVPLEIFTSPANMRTDIGTNPDTFLQTTPADMGTLLEDIYQCAEDNGGALLAAFPGQITPNACQGMLGYLEKDNVGALIQEGVPEGTVVAHKHGWVTYNGIMDPVCDAAIVFTPGGNYVLTIYTFHPVQIIWDVISPLYAELSQAVYNYFNLPTQ